MMKSQFLVIMAVFMCYVNAANDYCLKGSDAICMKYGAGYCCAKITATKGGETQTYHACAP